MAKKLTPAVALKRLQKAWTERRAAMDAVYASQHPRQDVMFSKCLELAPAEIQARWEAACKADMDARWAGHDAGVWYMSYGKLYWTARGRSGEVREF